MVDSNELLLSIGRQAAIPALAATRSLGNTLENLLALQSLGNTDRLTKDVRGATSPPPVRSPPAAIGVAVQPTPPKLLLASQGDR
jgi:hypothetical protein